MFDASTPAAAMTGPATASTTRVTPASACRSATTRTVAAATASSREPDHVSPRALETTLLETTTQSPARRPTPLASSTDVSIPGEVGAGLHLAEPDHGHDGEGGTGARGRHPVVGHAGTAAAMRSACSAMRAVDSTSDISSGPSKTSTVPRRSRVVASAGSTSQPSRKSS